ncbi:MAG TPA: deoxyribose-phosphate aldolase [Cytophagales bacterium]|nr:deoxyribose-phosphate aldolase [Cytophagales bacterium]
MDIASKIDHTLLKPACLENEIIKLCEEAIHYNFYSVCIPPFYLATAKEILVQTQVKLCTVIGFPLGYDTINTKVCATGEALEEGAHEIDMVINITAFKSGKLLTIYSEVEKLAGLCHQQDAFLKVIIETAYLNKDEIRMLCGICVDAGADFIKTSTGFAEKGATVEDVIFLREILPPKIKIKASGGIKTYNDAVNFLSSGVDRLGTSNGINILKMEGILPSVIGYDKTN